MRIAHVIARGELDGMDVQRFQFCEDIRQRKLRKQRRKHSDIQGVILLGDKAELYPPATPLSMDCSLNRRLAAYGEICRLSND